MDPSADENDGDLMITERKNNNVQILKSSERFVNKPGEGRREESKKMLPKSLA